MRSPFHAYYLARKLESLPDKDKFLPVFTSSDIKIYPFQIAAANFALRSPYQKGIVLCDESGMGKSHEAMLVITQSWYEGRNRILLVIPNADLLSQWVEMIEQKYTVPYVVLTNREEWQKNVTDEIPNAFEQEAVVITTTDFLADQYAAAKSVNWDITVFEEANHLSSVFVENGGKQTKLFKEIADGSFKILLTGTPIEKNIMDLYGLMYFIDETILPDAETYLKRYLRKPENYPELAERVSNYCFRTLRSQAKQYAKISKRIHITLEYAPSAKERELYDLLWSYLQKPEKIAFPEMDQYDLALMLLGLSGSSTAAILQTIKNIVKRLRNTPDAQTETDEFLRMQKVAESIDTDSKVRELLRALNKLFAILKKLGAAKKAVIFTESAETQKYLFSFLRDKYQSLVYNGQSGVDYDVLRQFKADGEVLISTDIGAKGFNLEEAALVINYDLLYNTLKMEQRIDRCHRLNQENDVIVLSFIDKRNYADVRKLELVSKRQILADGVFGVSDAVIGGFTDDLVAALRELTDRARTKEQVESDYQDTLRQFETENKDIVSSAEDILFTTFTKELADKVKITPKYVEERSKEINADLWEVIKSFFEVRNVICTDCQFTIDEEQQTVTAGFYTELPHLFYYNTGSRNKPYKSLKAYGMATDFKPHSGRITLASVIGRGIIDDIECADNGSITLVKSIEPCSIALYSVELRPIYKNIPVLIGKTESGKILTDDECQKILRSPIVSYKEGERKTAHWLKSISRDHCELDRYVDADEYIKQAADNLTDAQKEEVERIKLRAKSGKNALAHELDDLQGQIKRFEQELTANKTDRMEVLSLEKKIAALKQDFLKKQESQFFDEMQLDVELEKQVDEFLGKEKVTAKVVRQFVIEVEGQM